MSAFETQIPTVVLELGLGLLAFGLLFGAWFSRRAQVEPLGYWPMAWAILIGIGVLRVAAGSQPVEFFGTILYCALMLAGAYRYADRPIPPVLFPAAGGLALALLVLGYSDQTRVARYATLVLAPTILIAAAVLVHRAARERSASLVHRLLPGCFVGLAALGVYDDTTAQRSAGTIAIWLAAGVPIATIQAIAVFDRIRSRADEIARELAESVSLLQATLESTADGLLVVDSDQQYTSFNRRFGEMWRIPKPILEARERDPALRFVMQQLKEPQAFYDSVQDLYSDPEAESFDTLEFADGRVFERYSQPQRVGDEVVGRVWSFRDVTHRMQAEKVAADYKEHLEELVEERTEELMASRDRLREADRLVAIGTLAAGVAHQINNPIGAIMNSSEYALRCDGDDDAIEVFRRALRVNRDEAKRCRDIVRGMLQFARQEPVEKTLADLNQIVRMAREAVEPYANERQAEITLDLTEHPVELLMSPIEMEQVVVNLLHNAVESREAGALVHIRTFVDDESIHLEVRDDGRGIEEKDEAHIFDPFFSTRLREGGTGLGLSVAHGIVADHGGTIRVITAIGEGTTLVVDLPRRPQTSAQPLREDPADPAISPPDATADA